VSSATTAHGPLRIASTVPCSVPMRAAATVAILTLAACGSTLKSRPTGPKPDTKDPWKRAIAAQVRPYVDAEIVTGIAIGIIDGDKQWTYGFGKAGNGPA